MASSRPRNRLPLAVRLAIGLATALAATVASAGVATASTRPLVVATTARRHHPRPHGHHHKHHKVGKRHHKKTPPAAVIHSFKASPAKLSSKGGRVNLLGRVAHASTCTLTAHPAVKVAHPLLKCSNGIAHEEITLPANTKAAQAVFTFTLKAANTAKKAVTRTTKVTEAPAPPTASALVAKPSTVSDTGGSVVLTDTISRASHCEFASSPSLAGLPVSEACSSGTVSKTVTIPSGTSAASYRFTLTVSGPGGKLVRSTTAKRLPPPAPTAGAVEANPTTLSASGGDVSLSSTVTNASSCTYSVSPALSGFPDTVSCSGGTAAATASIPPNISSSQVDYTFSLSVSGPAGSATSSSPATVTEAANPGGLSTYPLTWSAANPAEPVPVDYELVSCPTSSFCAAADQSAGYVITFDGSSWGTPTQLASARDMIFALSCASSSLCLATDGTTLWSYDGSAWSAVSGPSFTSSGFSGLSCGAGQCMLVGSSGEVATTTDGSSWAGTSSLPSGTALESLSCYSTTGCEALIDSSSGSSETAAWDGSSWTTGTVVSASSQLFDFSCASASLCAAEGFDPSSSTNTLLVYNGSSWSTTSLPSANPQGGLTCAVGGGCYAIGFDTSNYNSYLYDYTTSSGAWTELASSTAAPPDNALSCVSNAFCMAVSGPYASLFDGTSWTQSSLGWGAQVQAVSCTSSSFCMAVDNNGQYLTYDGSSWTSPAPVASAFGLYGVSCSSSTDCVAIDGAGILYSWNGSTWQTASSALSGGGMPGAVSCTSSGFCAAVNNGQAVVFSGGSWGSPVTIDSNSDLTGVSCESSSFCVAVDSSGTAFTYDGSSWSSGTVVDPNAGSFGGQPEHVACLSGGPCVASGNDGYAELLQAGSWSSPDAVGGGATLFQPSCSQSGNFCVVPSSNGIYYLQQASDGSYGFDSTPQTAVSSNEAWIASSCAGSFCMLTATDNTTAVGT